MDFYYINLSEKNLHSLEENVENYKYFNCHNRSLIEIRLKITNHNSV